MYLTKLKTRNIFFLSRLRNHPYISLEPVRTEYRVIVKNLSNRVSWQDLKDYARKFGEVTYANAHKPIENEGYLEFASKLDMIAALNNMKGAELDGKKLELIDKSKISSHYINGTSRVKPIPQSDSCTDSNKESDSNFRKRSKSQSLKESNRRCPTGW